MSMKSKLLSEEFGPYQEYQETDDTFGFDDADEESSCLRPQYINEEEVSYFHSLPSETINTRKGHVKVAVQGDRTKKGTALVTLHDIGQDHIKCFQSFFCFHQTKRLLNNFTVYHIDFPGQEEKAQSLPEDYAYPTMDEMADVVSEVIDFLGLRKTICVGVGAGANVFIRLAMKRANMVEGLVLFNGSCNTSSWTEWGQAKMSNHYLKTKGMTAFVQDYLLHHYFGKAVDATTNSDLVGLVRDQLLQLTPRNVGLFIESYSKRDALKITKPVVGQTNNNSLKCGVLIITGDRSPSLDETILLNSKLDPSKTSWMKISEATSLVLEEQPTTVANALILFLQGLGYAMKVQPPSLGYSIE